MKKLSAVILSLLLILAFAACNPQPQSSDVGQNGNSAEGGASSVGKVENQPSGSDALGSVSSQPDSALSAESSNPASGEKRLSRDEAIEKALAKAGVKRADVRDLEAELDRDRGGIYWEVSFEYGKNEYEYDINASSGEIVKVERERDD